MCLLPFKTKLKHNNNNENPKQRTIQRSTKTIKHENKIKQYDCVVSLGLVSICSLTVSLFHGSQFLAITNFSVQYNLNQFTPGKG